MALIFDNTKIAEGNFARVQFPQSHARAITGVVTGVHGTHINLEFRERGRLRILTVEASEIFYGGVTFSWREKGGGHKHFPDDALIIDDGGGGGTGGATSTNQLSVANPALESVAGAATSQAGINAENSEQIKALWVANNTTDSKVNSLQFVSGAVFNKASEVLTLTNRDGTTVV